MSKNKQGRVPVSKKSAESAMVMDNFDYEIFRVDGELKKELEDAGLAYRWINAPKYFKGGNFHRSGWKAYRSKKAGTSEAFDSGINAEGFIIRNDMLLAVKPAADQERWKARVRNHAARLSGSAAAAKTSELKQTVSELGGGKIFEGYEENED